MSLIEETSNLATEDNETKNSAPVLDHQLNKKNQDILFELINHLLSSSIINAIDFSKCENIDDAIDKMKNRIKFLENRLNFLQEKIQHINYENEWKNKCLSVVKNNRSYIENEIAELKLERDELALKFPKLQNQYSILVEQKKGTREKSLISEEMNKKAKSENEALMRSFLTLTLPEETLKLPMPNISKEMEKVQNFNNLLDSIIEISESKDASS